MYRCLLILFVTFSANAQTLRYKDLIFTDIIVQNNLHYAPGKQHRFDLYQPKDDTATQRPLIIWLHGGGFKFGSKAAPGVHLWSNTFAQRGYVCAGLNYTLSKKNTLTRFDELKKACYRAVTDIDSAIAFFKQHAKEYRLDTTRIIIGGNSAGAMIALQAAYSNRADLASLAHLPAGTAKPETNPSHIAGVVNFWGGLFRLEWIGRSKIPLVSVYGDRDRVVPLDRRDTSLFGGIAIHKRAKEKGVPNALKIFEGYSHELQKHFNPIFPVSYKTKERWLNAGVFVAEFLWKELFN